MITILKAEITNSWTDDTIIQWYVCDDRAQPFELNRRKAQVEGEVAEWNRSGGHHKSIRFCSFTEYSVTDFLAMDMDWLKGMSVHLFYDIQKLIEARLSEPLKVGDVVRLKPGADAFHTCPEGRENNDEATIQSFRDDMVRLNHDLHGCELWLTNALERVI